MRDIRADLVERIEQASKAAADAKYLYSVELGNLEAKYQPMIERYEIEMDQLNYLLRCERERHHRLARETKLPPHRVLERNTAQTTTTTGKVEKPNLEEPIRSEADAKGRLDRLTTLVRNYVQKEEIVSNIHRLPTDTVNRSYVA